MEEERMIGKGYIAAAIAAVVAVAIAAGVLALHGGQDDARTGQTSPAAQGAQGAQAATQGRQQASDPYQAAVEQRRARGLEVGYAVEGISAVEGVTEDDVAAMGNALDLWVGGDIGEGRLSVTDSGAEGGVSFVTVHDADTGADLMLTGTDGSWRVLRTSDTLATEKPQKAAKDDKKAEKEEKEEKADPVEVQNDWSPISNFDNSIFDVGDAVAFADEKGISKLLSATQQEAALTGVSQVLSENSLSLDGPAAVFAEKGSLEKKDGQVKVKLMVNHTGGHTVLDATFVDGEDGVYLALYGEDE